MNNINDNFVALCKTLSTSDLEVVHQYLKLTEEINNEYKKIFFRLGVLTGTLLTALLAYVILK